eukprot:GHVT01052700.1.p1 GENE.GHVT01052700.1~~GHVT01052700.1.p1  ORF type:complete len:110 (+),score=14.93 GHVT01052700.1:182-511(+)
MLKRVAGEEGVNEEKKSRWEDCRRRSKATGEKEIYGQGRGQGFLSIQEKEALKTKATQERGEGRRPGEKEAHLQRRELQEGRPPGMTYKWRRGREPHGRGRKLKASVRE